METVDNQINENNPPETKQTYDRLRSEGYSHGEARRLIGCALSSELFEMLNEKRLYNGERYVADLARLPKMPWD